MDIEKIIKSATLINGDILFLKLSCILHPNEMQELQSDLQQRTKDIKIIILPNELDFRNDVNA